MSIINIYCGYCGKRIYPVDIYIFGFDRNRYHKQCWEKLKKEREE